MFIDSLIKVVASARINFNNFESIMKTTIIRKISLRDLFPLMSLYIEKGTGKTLCVERGKFCLGY